MNGSNEVTAGMTPGERLKHWFILLILPLVSRKAARSLATVVAVGLVLTAFGAAAAAPASTPEKVNVIIGAGTMGGNQQVIGEVIAETIRRGAPNYKVTNIATSDVPSLKLLAKPQGGRDIVLAWDIQLRTAAKGMGDFEKPVDFRTLMPASVVTFHAIALSKSGVTSFKDLINKKYPMKVSLGRVGTAPEITSKLIFKELGVTYDDIKSWGGRLFFQSGDETETAFRDGRVDTIIYMAEIPYPRAQNLQRDFALRLLPITPEMVTPEMRNWGIRTEVVKAGAYDFVKTDTLTYCQTNYLVVRPDMPESEAYTIVKSILERQDYLINAFKQFERLEGLIKTMSNLPFPLHPGPAKYFKERGWLK